MSANCVIGRYPNKITTATLNVSYLYFIIANLYFNYYNEIGNIVITVASGYSWILTYYM